MRKLCLLTAVLLLVSAWVVAQDSSQAAGAKASQTSSNAGETTTIEGCLSGSAGNYTLTDKTGKTYQLQGDSSKLGDQVGHQVRINGSEGGAVASATAPSGANASASTSSSGSNPSSSSSASKPSDSAPNRSGSASAAIQFNVSGVTKISDTCTASPTSK